MTTTIIYSGKGDKNSSKVLAPPGGKSNDIFNMGGGDPTPAPAPVQRRQQPTTSPFATSATPQATGPAKPFKPVSSFNPVTGEPISSPQRSQPQQPPPPQQQQQPPAQRQQPQQQISTPPQPQQQQQHAHPQGASGEAGRPSVKIYNPPGGKSSITF